MIRFRFGPLIIAVGLWLHVGEPVRAQWGAQTIQIAQRWNSVYLEIDPFPAKADLLFAGLPIESAWTIAESTSAIRPECDGTAQEDPDCIPSASGNWWIWVRPGSPNRSAMNSRLITGGRVYLLKATQATSFVVTGRPNSTKTRWRTGFNLVGFHVDSDLQRTVSLRTFLEPSATHNAASAFTISPGGVPTRITDLSAEMIEPGKGYWVSSSAATEYDGPITIDNGSLRGLDFARSLTDNTVSIENRARTGRVLSLRYLASATPPAGQPAKPPVDLQLQRFIYQVEGAVSGGGDNLAFRWVEFTQASYPLGAAGQPRLGEDAALLSIRLAVNRTGLAPAEVSPDGTGSEYQGLLEVSDGAGFRRLLPLSAQVVNTVTAGPASSHVGLWAGHVVINSVSWVLAGTSSNPDCDPSNPDDGEECDAVRPRLTATEFAFPIIIHVGTDGTHRLLDEVAVMWRDAKPVKHREQCPDLDLGYYVLVTPECPRNVLDCLVPGSLHDGEEFSRRLSTPAYALNPFAGFNEQTQSCDPPDEACVDLNGTLGLGTSLAATIHLPGENRLNPFKHFRHPDHDCDPPSECYDVTRKMFLDFTATPPSENLRDRWGDTVLGGNYSEMVKGLHKAEIKAAGRFILNKVSAAGRLNTDQ